MKKSLTIKFNKPINLYCLTDVHIGHKDHDKDKFNKIIKLIQKDKNAYCFFNGDNLDFTPNGYHNARSEQILSNDEQIDYFRNLLTKTLKDKVLFFRAGNHELRADNLVGTNIYDSLSKETFVPQVSVGASLTTFVINGKKSTLVSSHGMGGSSMTIMKNLTASFRKADAFFIGHNHEFKNINEGYQTFDLECNLSEDVPMLCGGSFQSYAEYAAELNKRPTQTGCYVLRIDENGISIKEKLVK